MLQKLEIYSIFYPWNRLTTGKITGDNNSTLLTDLTKTILNTLFLFGSFNSFYVRLSEIKVRFIKLFSNWVVSLSD